MSSPVIEEGGNRVTKYNFDEIVDRSKQRSKKWTDYSKFGVEVSEDFLPLWIADMDFKCEPRIAQALQEVVDYGIYGYDSPSPDFFDSFISWQKKHNDWEVSKDWLVPVPGVVPGICNAVRTFTKEGDRILIQPPVYYPFFKSIDCNRRIIVENELVLGPDQYSIDFDDLDAKLASCKMFIFCSPHNPVGRVWSQEELQKVAQLCIKHDVILISDEIHSDLIFKGSVHQPIANLSKEIADRTITLMAPSKTFNVAGLAQSVAIISNPDLREAYAEGLGSTGMMHMASFAAAGFPAAYEYGQEWLEQAMNYIEGNVDYVLAYIKENLPEIKVYRPQGTFLMWLDFNPMVDQPDQVMEQLIHKGKLILDDGSVFGQSGQGFCRLNVASPRSIIEEAMARMKRAFE